MTSFGCPTPRPARRTHPTGGEGAMDRRRKLTHAELEAEIAEALPERAVMSTMSVTSLDPTAGTVEAVSDGVTDSAAATTEPVMTTADEMATTSEPVASPTDVD